MSVSLLVLMGFTKLSFVSCAFSINMYFIPLLLAQTLSLIMYLMCVGRLYHNHGASSNFCCYKFSLLGPLVTAVYFFWRTYSCPTLLFPFKLVVCFAAATLRLHISACSVQIWSSLCLNYVDIFSFFIVSLVNTASWDAVADTKFMKVSFI